MSMSDLYKQTLLKCCFLQVTAIVGGTNCPLPTGTLKIVLRPVGGDITAAYNAGTTFITFGQNLWTPEIHFRPDGTNQKLVLKGANIVTDVIAYYEPTINTSEATS